MSFMAGSIYLFISAAMLSRKLTHLYFCKFFHSCSMASGLLFPVMAIIVIVFLQPAAGKSETNIVFYMHDNLRGSNLSSFAVAGVNGSSSSPGKFGTVIVMSDVITKIPDSESGSENIVGRAQGTYVNTNLVTGLDFFMAFTVIFQNMEYNGSTLELQGTDRFDQPQSEYAVVGGTGKFRFASGYAVVTTESSAGPNAVLKFNTTFLLPL